MKKLLSVIVLLSMATIAQASIYVGASAGYLTDAEEPLYSGRVGINLGEWGGIRHSVEGEYGMSSASYGIFEVDMYPMMLNYRGEYDLSEKLFTYFGAGLGQVSVDVEWFGRGGSGDGFAWQVFGGLGVRLTEKLSLIGGVRFMDASDITVKGQSIGSENDTEFSVGAQFAF